MKDGSPLAGSRGRAPLGVWGQSPHKLTLLKIMQKYFVTETLDNICSTKSTLEHFQPLPPLSILAGAHACFRRILMIWWQTAVNAFMCERRRRRHHGLTCVVVNLRLSTLNQEHDDDDDVACSRQISHTSVRQFLHHHCHHPLLLSSTQGSKLIFSTNPFLHSSSTFPPTRLTPRTPAVFRFSRACRFNLGTVC